MLGRDGTEHKSCGVVVIRDANILLLHYPSGHWDFPKGHVELGENEIQTALRELKEETGIEKVELIDGFRKQVSYYYRFEGKLIHKVVVYFIATTEVEKVVISHEHQGFVWLPWQDAGKKITFANSYNILLSVQAFLHKNAL